MMGARSNLLHGRLIWGVIALFFAAQLVLAFRLNLNWDEYFFLSHIHTFLAGRPLDPMQTFHVHFLGWLPALPLSDPDQIVAGRLVMMLCQAGALLCVYRIARQFAPHQAALIAVAAWCGTGFALTQGMSFRTDPLAGFLIMVSLALLFSGRITSAKSALSGLSAAIALLVTIKAAIFLPCFAAALIWQMRERADWPKTIVSFTMAAIALGVGGTALWLWHSSTLTPFPALEAAQTTATAKAGADTASILDRVVFSQELLPRWDYIRRWMPLSLFALLLVIAGIWATATQQQTNKRARLIVLLLLASPILTLLIYRNAFPYFYPFMMLPVVVAAAAGWDAVTRPLWRNVALAGIAVVIIAQFATGVQQGQSSQRAIANVAGEMFPGGTRYIDRNAMLPSFQKSGYFMSSWGIEGMVASGTPALANVIDREAPPLLIVNAPVLAAALDPAFDWPHTRLMAEEERALRDSYIPHWDAIWVAGKTLPEDAGAFDMRIPGTYTLECDGERQLNGQTADCGKTITLSKGAHNWSGGPATLRWGDNIHRPNTTPSKEPIYYGF